VPSDKKKSVTERISMRKEKFFGVESEHEKGKRKALKTNLIARRMTINTLKWKEGKSIERSKIN